MRAGTPPCCPRACRWGGAASQARRRLTGLAVVMAAVEIVAPSAHRPFEIGEAILVYAGAFAATGDGLAGWAAGAAEGRVCVYARAARAPGEVGARARTLMAQGLITLR